MTREEPRPPHPATTLAIAATTALVTAFATEAGKWIWERLRGENKTDPPAPPAETKA